MTRTRHIETARELARELQSAYDCFSFVSLEWLSPAELWATVQPEPALAERFRALLDELYFDGIRSRFFGEFDASKLILPIAADIAARLETLAEDLEMQMSSRHATIPEARTRVTRADERRT